MRQKTICGAHARTTGQPCQAKALTNGRCRLHGGKATGPKTAEGRARMAARAVSAETILKILTVKRASPYFWRADAGEYPGRGIKAESSKGVPGRA